MPAGSAVFDPSFLDLRRLEVVIDGVEIRLDGHPFEELSVDDRSRDFIVHPVRPTDFPDGRGVNAVIVMTNGFHPRVKTAAIGLVVLATINVTALADEVYGIVTSVDLTGEAIVVSRLDRKTGEHEKKTEKIKLGEEAVILLAGVRIGPSDLKAIDGRIAMVRREAGVATSVVVDPRPGENGCQVWYLRRVTDSGFEVYWRYSTRKGIRSSRKRVKRSSVPVHKGLVIETPYDLRPGRALAVFWEKWTPVRIVTMYDIDGK